VPQQPPAFVNLTRVLAGQVAALDQDPAQPDRGNHLGDTWDRRADAPLR